MPPGSAAYKALFEQLIPEYLTAGRSRTVTAKAGALTRIRSILSSFPNLNNNTIDVSGLRLDLALVDPTTGNERWLDVSMVHTASPSYVCAERRAISARMVAAEASAGLAPDPKAQ